MNTDDTPETAPRSDAAPTPAVDDAFLALDQQLGVAANQPGADLDRCHAFRKAVREVAARWKDGRPAPVMRTQKPAGAHPAAAGAGAEG